MKKILIGILLFFFILGCFTLWYVNNSNTKRERKRKIVGTYTLDVTRTRLGVYADSTEYYKGLKLILRENMTFSMNMSVPFIADSSGTWKVGGMEEWSELYYDCCHNKYKEGMSGDQFSEPYEKDSILYINSAMPKASQRDISNVGKVYFKKDIAK